ncbi:hypothetical protein BaRGS_00018154, partial [Batillaria attramentaria]
MATDVSDRSVDSRVVCSVCLEPYRGRQPKLLPCFHTFCLPCLSQIALKKSQGSKQDVPPPSPTISCPTCRLEIPVPSGGVQCLQANIYVDSSDAAPPPVSSKSPSATLAVQQGDGHEPNLQETVKTQVQVMDEVLARMAEDKEEIIRQRQALEQDIKTRYTAGDFWWKLSVGSVRDLANKASNSCIILYSSLNAASGLRHMAEARDQCLSSLRCASQAAHDKLEADMTVARSLHTTLSQLAAHEDAAREVQSSPIFQAALLNEASFRHYKQLSKKTDPKRYFSYSHSVAPSLVESLEQFMGTVVPFGQTPDLEKPDLHVDKIPVNVDAEYMDLLTNANLRNDFTNLQKDVEKLQNSLATLEHENAKLRKLVKKNVAGEEAEIGQLRSDLTAMQKDVGNMRQDLDLEKKSTGGQIMSVKDDLATTRSEISALRTMATTAKNSAGTIRFTPGVDDKKMAWSRVDGSGNLNSCTGHVIVKVTRGQRHHGVGNRWDGLGGVMCDVCWSGPSVCGHVPVIPSPASRAHQGNPGLVLTVLVGSATRMIGIHWYEVNIRATLVSGSKRHYTDLQLPVHLQVA